MDLGKLQLHHLIVVWNNNIMKKILKVFLFGVALLGFIGSISAQPYTEINKFLANDGSTMDFFGRSIAISGNRMVVGAVGDDDIASNAGAIYI